MGGTMLGSSRGEQDPAEVVDTLMNWKVSILIAIGGDGTLRGASAIAAEIKRRNLPISIIGVPKTIDNDIAWIDRSFGFLTAVEESRPAIMAAHAEAAGAFNGLGVVKLMGRHSGFIATCASLANPDVNFCLIPEVPFTMEGAGGLLEVLRARLERRRHAVVVVAEGAGQGLFEAAKQEKDKSGNLKLRDIGSFLCESDKSTLREVWDGRRHQVHRPQLYDSQPAGEFERFLLLPDTGTACGSRRNGGADRYGSRTYEQRVHTHPEPPGHLGS